MYCICVGIMEMYQDDFKSMSCIRAIYVCGSSLLSRSCFDEFFFYCSSILEVVFSVVGHVLIGMLQSKRAILVMPGTLLKLNRERAWNVVLHTWWPQTLPEMLTFMHMWLIGSSHSRDTHAWCQHNCPNRRLKSVLITHQQLLQWWSIVLLMAKLMASFKDLRLSLLVRTCWPLLLMSATTA